jgi:UDP-2,3-diacylglucosamine pyrophosphatase LpxH
VARFAGGGESRNRLPFSIAPMHRFRTIWISDLHLGTRGCKAGFLLDFLRRNDADTIYLVGDIIDGWRLKKSWYWPQTHNDLVQKVLRKVRKGARVIYIPGNHDEWLRDYTLLQFGGVEVADEAIHVTADGRRLLVIHGDVFDAVVKHARWLAVLGEVACIGQFMNEPTEPRARGRRPGREALGMPRICLAAVDNDGRHAADAVTTGHRRDVGIVHVANFDIVLGARQKLDQFYSLDAAGTAGRKDFDFSALSHIVIPRIPPALTLLS